MRTLIILTAAALCVAGCAPVIGNQSPRLVDREKSSTEVRQDPDRIKANIISPALPPPSSTLPQPAPSCSNPDYPASLSAGDNAGSGTELCR